MCAYSRLRWIMWSEPTSISPVFSVRQIEVAPASRTQALRHGLIHRPGRDDPIDALGDLAYLGDVRVLPAQVDHVVRAHLDLPGLLRAPNRGSPGLPEGLLQRGLAGLGAQGGLVRPALGVVSRNPVLACQDLHGLGLARRDLSQPALQLLPVHAEPVVADLGRDGG